MGFNLMSLSLMVHEALTRASAPGGVSRLLRRGRLYSVFSKIGERGWGIHVMKFGIIALQTPLKAPEALASPRPYGSVCTP